MAIRTAVLVVTILAGSVAQAADWKTTFDADAVVTHLAGDDLVMAVVAAGKPLVEPKAAAQALSNALRTAKGNKSLVKVGAAAALAKLDDAAIVKRLKKTKANCVLVVRVTPGQGGAPSALVSIYDLEGAALGSFTGTAGSPLAAKAEGAATASAAGQTASSSAAPDDNAGASGEAAPPAQDLAPMGTAMTETATTETATTEPGTTAAATEPEPAQESPGAEPVSEADQRVGLALNVSGGLHQTSQAVSSGSGSSTDVDESWAVEIHPAFRYVGSQAVGLTYFLNTYSMPASSSMKYHGAMATWRYYLVFGAFDPFAEVGVGWCWLNTSIKSGTTEISSKAQGINLAAGLGLNFYVLDFLAVGAMARYNIPAFTKLCTKTGSSETCGTPSSNMKDLFFAGTIVFNPFPLL